MRHLGGGETTSLYMNVDVKFGVAHEGPKFEIFKYYLK